MQLKLFHLSVKMKMIEYVRTMCNGKLQEKEGPAIAKKLLSELGIEDACWSQICKEMLLIK